MWCAFKRTNRSKLGQHFICQKAIGYDTCQGIKYLTHHYMKMQLPFFSGNGVCFPNPNPAALLEMVEGKVQPTTSVTGFEYVNLLAFANPNFACPGELITRSKFV